MARARLVAWLLSEHPCVLRLLCARNAAGLTPLHCCVWSCSAETLRVGKAEWGMADEMENSGEQNSAGRVM